MRRWTRQGHFGDFEVILLQWVPHDWSRYKVKSSTKAFAIYFQYQLIGILGKQRKLHKENSKQCMSVRSTILHWNRWNIGILTHFKWSSKGKKLCRATLFCIPKLQGNVKWDEAAIWWLTLIPNLYFTCKLPKRNLLNNGISMLHLTTPLISSPLADTRSRIL